MVGLVMVILFTGVTAFAVAQVGRGLLRGRVESAFSRHMSTLSLRDEPLRFVLSLGGWALIGFFAVFAVVAAAPEVPSPLWSLVPAGAGPIVSAALLARHRARAPDPPSEPTHYRDPPRPDTTTGERERRRIAWTIAPVATVLIAPFTWALLPLPEAERRRAWIATAVLFAFALLLLAIGARRRRAL